MIDRPGIVPEVGEQFLILLALVGVSALLLAVVVGLHELEATVVTVGFDNTGNASDTGDTGDADNPDSASDAGETASTPGPNPSADATRHRRQMPMYLPEATIDELNALYDRLDARSKLANQGGLEKHKDFMEEVASLALEHEDELADRLGVER